MANRKTVGGAIAGVAAIGVVAATSAHEVPAFARFLGLAEKEAPVVVHNVPRQPPIDFPAPPIHVPDFPVVPEIPGLQEGISEARSILKSLRSGQISEEQALYKAACATISAYVDKTDEHGYVSDAIYSRLPDELGPNGYANKLIKSRVENLSNLIAIIFQDQPQLTRFYIQNCLQ